MKLGLGVLLTAQCANASAQSETNRLKNMYNDGDDRVHNKAIENSVSTTSLDTADQTSQAVKTYAAVDVTSQLSDTADLTSQAAKTQTNVDDTRQLAERIQRNRKLSETQKIEKAKETLDAFFENQMGFYDTGEDFINNAVDDENATETVYDTVMTQMVSNEQRAFVFLLEEKLKEQKLMQWYAKFYDQLSQSPEKQKNFGLLWAQSFEVQSVRDQYEMFIPDALVSKTKNDEKFELPETLEFMSSFENIETAICGNQMWGFATAQKKAYPNMNTLQKHHGLRLIQKLVKLHEISKSLQKFANEIEACDHDKYGACQLGAFLRNWEEINKYCSEEQKHKMGKIYFFLTGYNPNENEEFANQNPHTMNELKAIAKEMDSNAELKVGKQFVFLK